MPVAAVPRYLGDDFSAASPGLRFGLYLAVWTSRADQEREVRERTHHRSREAEEIRGMLDRDGMDRTIEALQRRERGRRPLPALWRKNDHGAREAWMVTARLTGDDQARMAALARRQRALAGGIGPPAGLLVLEAVAVSPFTTGLGNEHPLENGFAFLDPYGLPYLPGSGVKGVLRQAARELSSGEWGDPAGWDEETITALFGREADGGTAQQRGALTFWDVVPEIAGGALAVEVMTPHQSHYYQGKETPHESGQPKPINYLTVPPGSRFTFHVQCHRPFLECLVPELARDERWKSLLEAAFGHAFEWLGFGAKTAVGYGALAAPGATPEPEAPGARGGRSTSLASSEDTWTGATLTWDAGGGRLTATQSGTRSTPLSGDAAQKFMNLLPDERRARLKKRKELKPVTVVVEVRGNQITLKRPG